MANFLQNLRSKLVLTLVLLTLLMPLGLGATFVNTAQAQGGFCGTLSNEFRGFVDCNDDFTSFTEFDGGLTAVGPEGFDKSLTRAQDARTFVKNIVNFALGFLGLIAVVVVIYGGFLYVTAAVDEGQAEKGKNAIKFAIIGILIIFASFAIVNTVIQAPGNLDPSGNGPSGSGGASNRAQVANFNGAAEQVKLTTADFIRTYENYFNQSVIIQKMMNFDRVDELTTRQDILDYLSFLRRNLIELQNRSIPSTRSIALQSSAISNTGLAARVVIDSAIDPAIEILEDIITKERNEEETARLLRNGLGNFFDDVRGSVDDLVEGSKDAVNAVGDLFTGSEGEKGFNKRSEDINCFLPPELRNVENRFDCIGTKESTSTSVGNDIIDRINAFLETALIENGINKDYNERLETITNEMKNIEASIVNFGTPQTTGEIDRQFDVVFDLLANSKAENISFNVLLPSGEALKGEFDASEAFNNTAVVRELLTELSELFELLDKLEFVGAFIQANVVSGSAPLVVRFDGSGSADPSDRSLTDENFEWDLDGNGRFGETTNSLGCDEKKGSVVGCIYRNPGSYRVGMKVTSSITPDDASGLQESRGRIIFPGIAFLTIQVKEPVAKIDLEARFGEATKILRRFDDDGFIEQDRDRMVVTLTDASSGITFDASGTAANSEATGNRIINYTWDFGDGSEDSRITGNTQEFIAPTHSFVANGTYTVVLEVQDEAGNEDRKIFDLVVTSLAADLEVNQNRGDLNTEFIFDASRSKSDGGEIKTFTWSIDGVDDVTSDQDSSRFKHIFDEPGSYTVKVVVTDSLQNSDSATIEVLVESQEPRAIVSKTFVPNQPSTVILDATDSFDPDINDTLNYQWTIFNAREGTDYTVIEGKLSGNESEAGKIKVKFTQQRNYVVELRVRDQHQDERLRKEVRTEIDVNIQTLVDLKLGDDHQQAVIIDDEGEATVKISVASEFGKTVEIKFGDGQREVGAFSNGKFTVNHLYDRSGLYEVVIKAFGKDGDSNELKTTVVVGRGDTIIPIVEVDYDGISFSPESLPIVARNELVTFKANKSLNNDGSKNGLIYSWNFGDGAFAEGATVTHAYKELAPNPPGSFEVTLVVENRQGTQAQSKFNIKVQSVPPVINSIKIEPLDPKSRSTVGTDSRLVTPFPVRLEAQGVSDADGEIKQYRFYYVPVLDPQRKLGVKTSSDPIAEVEVDTLGVEGERNEFAFCVDIIDNEGNEVICQERFQMTDLPKLTAINGRNERPVASFEVDRSNINVGETINFTSTSKDSDGEIVSYQWDLDGDGSFANDAPQTQSVLEHSYSRKAPQGGYVVRLKVVDDKGAAAVSEPIVIAVDSILNDPVAAFTTQSTNNGVVRFTNNSRADRANGGEIERFLWDFDIATDSDGDGKANNDIDSEAQSPEHRYPEAGEFTAQLTVVDNEGNINVVANPVTVIDTSANLPVDTNFEELAQSDLRAVLSTNPNFDPVTKTVFLSGDTGAVTFNFNQSVGNISRLTVDNNIFFDTNSGRPNTAGDGIRNNDVDFETSDKNGSHTVTYRKEFEPIEVQLTVFNANGDLSRDKVKITFGTRGLGQASLSGEGNPVGVIVILAVTGLIGVLLYDKYFSDKPKKATRKLSK